MTNNPYEPSQDRAIVLPGKSSGKRDSIFLAIAAFTASSIIGMGLLSLIGFGRPFGVLGLLVQFFLFVATLRLFRKIAEWL